MTTPKVGAEHEFKVSSVGYGKLKWIYIEKPTAKEVEYLRENFNFHHLNLDDVISRVQRPKIDEYGDHLFIVLHFPVFDKRSRVTTPSEVDIFIGENYVVTVHKQGDLKPLAKFFEECQLDEGIRSTYLCRSSGFLLYHILDTLVNYCFPILRKVSDNLEKAESFVFARPVPETVNEISLIRRDLISFRRVIHPQIPVVESLEKEEYPFFKEDQDIYFGDIADHIRKIWDGLEDAKELADGLMDTANWLTSHRLQETMRMLTIVMALLTPPMLIASIYGMNVALPGGVDKGSLTSFVLLLLVMFMCVIGMLWLLHRRRWL